MVPFIDFFLSALLAYFICGLISSLFLLFFQTKSIDPALANSRKKIRIFLIPGVLATWPYFVFRAFKKNKNKTYELKKAHIIIWVLIICSLPGMLIFSTDQLVYNDINAVDQHNAKSEKFRIENEFIAIQKKSNLIRINLKKPFKSASSLVFSCDQQGNRIKLLGQIQNQKLYEFKTQEDIQGILIYDGIKNKTITKLLLP